MNDEIQGVSAVESETQPEPFDASPSGTAEESARAAMVAEAPTADREPAVEAAPEVPPRQPMKIYGCRQRGR
jgi:hypothetical protein